MHRRARSTGLALSCASALACVQPSIFDPLGGGGEEESTGEEGGFVPDRPSFIDPADGILRLPSDRREAINLRIRAARQGSTFLRIDGVVVGTLPAQSPIGRITSDRLVLELDGVLPVGVHTLELFNAGDEFSRASPPVGIEVEAVPEPSVSLELDALPLGPASELFAAEGEAGPQLAWIEAGSPDTLVFAPIDEDGRWPVDAARRIPLATPWVDSTTRSVDLRVDLDAIYLASASDPAGERIAWQAWDAETLLALDSGSELGRDDTVFADREFVALSPPRFVGPRVVVPVLAPSDTETSQPGDHALWSYPLDGSSPPVWTRLVLASGEDLEALGPLLDLRRAPEDGAMLTRLSGAWVRRLEVEGGHAGIRLPDPVRHGAPVGEDELAFAGIAGALGSRTTLSLDGRGGARLIHEALFARRANTIVSADLLPAFPPTGDIAVGVIAGRALFAVAYGEAAGVVLLSSDGDRLEAHPTGVNCERVVLSPGRAGQAAIDEEGREFTLPLVCLQGGQRFEGRIRAQF